MNIHDEALDRLADKLAHAFSDPTNPDNKLKRKAKRNCLICSKEFRSDLSMLCVGALTCSDACQQQLTKEGGE